MNFYSAFRRTVPAFRTWISRTQTVKDHTAKHARLFRFTRRAAPAVPVPVMFGLSLWGKKSEEEKKPAPAVPVKSREEIIVEQADELYRQNDMVGLYEHLVAHKETNNDEILWRLARAACDRGKLSANDADRRASMFEAFDYVKKALDINPNNFAVHKWYAILLDYTGEYLGTKERISRAFQVKEHLLKSIELNPKDATTVYSLGYWCFLFADMPWYQRKVAAVVFATPPTSSYEEALGYFLKAENADPGFYSMNLLMLGKTYLRMGNKEKALSFLQQTKDYPIKTPDDKQAHKEAVELLSSLGVK